MKEFKRGIHQLEWENKKCEMEVRQCTASQYRPRGLSLVCRTMDAAWVVGRALMVLPVLGQGCKLVRHA